MSVSCDKSALVTATLDASKDSDLETCLEATICPAIDTEFGLTPGTCTAEKLKDCGVTIGYNADVGHWYLVCPVSYSGNWVAS